MMCVKAAMKLGAHPVFQLKVGNRPVNMSIDQTSGHYWL